MNNVLVFPEYPVFQKMRSVFLITLLFFLPISSSGKSICLGLSVMFILLTPNNLAQLRKLVLNPWCQSTMSLFLVVLIACFWTPGNTPDKLFVLQKYSKLLYLPILVLGFRDLNVRYLGIHAFLFAITLICGISILKFHGYLQLYSINPDQIFRNHIMTGHFSAFSAYLSLFFFLRESNRLSRAGYGLMALMLSYQLLFINQGRTGYVMWALLMVVLIIQQGTWKQILIAAPLLSLLLGVSYIESPVMQKNSYQVLQNLNSYQHEKKNTDVGYRLQFHQYAYQLFERHPLIGNGTGSFIYYFKAENPIPAWPSKLSEPHSQYWQVAAEFGFVGLVALAWFFWTLFAATKKLKTMKQPAIALLISFMIGNLTDSLLFYSGSGYFFLIMMALFLGEQKKP